jgi:hypothetical protein
MGNFLLGSGPDYFALTFYGREALHTKAMMGRRLVLLRPRWS